MVRIEGRIRYCKDWNGLGEYYLFEIKHVDAPDADYEWGVERAYKVWDYQDVKSVMVHKTVMDHIWKWQTHGINFHFC